jgi:cyclase
MIPRVIPTLLLRGNGLVKTREFRDPVYLGDPINVIRIFNDKEVDELVLLDIAATPEGRTPNFRIVSEIAGECFMPLGYGGGIRSLDDIEKLLSLGVEKVVVNSMALEQPEIVKAAAARFGTSTLVVSMDVKNRLLRGQRVVGRSAKVMTNWAPAEYACHVEELGAGELLLNSVDRDGNMQGYDLELIRSVADAVGIPVVAAGGAANVNDFRRAVIDAGASAAAAGSMFVFQGPHRAVLISFPSRGELERLFAAR